MVRSKSFTLFRLTYEQTCIKTSKLFDFVVTQKLVLHKSSCNTTVWLISGGKGSRFSEWVSNIVFLIRTF